MATQTRTHASTGTATYLATLLFVSAAMAAAAGFLASPVRPVKLMVRMAPGFESTSVVRGSESVDVFAVEARSVGGQSRVTNVAIAAFGDSDGAAPVTSRDLDIRDRFTSCELISSRSEVVSAAESIGTDGVTFSDLNLIVPSDDVARFTVRCNLSNVAVADGGAERFAFALEGESSVTAEDTHGNAISGAALQVGGESDPGLNLDGAAVSLRVSDAGQLSVSLSDSTPSADIILRGSADEHVASFDFEARGEDFTIDKLTFDIGNDEVESASIECNDASGSATRASAYLLDGAAIFTGADCYVAAGSTATVDLMVSTSTLAPDSGASFAASLNARAPGSFEAVGMTTGSVVDETDVSAVITGMEMTVRKSVPTFSLSAGSPSGAAIPGTSEVLRFNVAANSRGPVDIQQLTFAVSSTDEAGSGWNNCGDGDLNNLFGDHDRWAVYANDDLSTIISDEGDWSLLKADGTACSQAAEPVAYAVLNFGADSTSSVPTVEAGAVTTFVVKVNTTGASTESDDAFRLDLLSEADLSALERTAILWNDGEDTSISGEGVEMLPVTGGTLQY